MKDEKIKNEQSYNQDPNLEHGKDNKGHNGDNGNHGNGNNGGQAVKPASSHSLPYVPCVRN